jgi:hypothetical protein
MSSKKAGDNPAHRKPKVSWATQIAPGLVDPKAQPMSCGRQPMEETVNIPSLLLFFDGETQFPSLSALWYVRSWSQETALANPGHSFKG